MSKATAFAKVRSTQDYGLFLMACGLLSMYSTDIHTSTNIIRAVDPIDVE